MSENGPVIPRSFWIISSLALVWNIVGIANYVLQVTMTEETLLTLPAGQQAVLANVPTWATSMFATATSAGALGCVLLLLRSSVAIPVLVLSLVCVFGQTYYAFGIANALELLGPTSVILPALIIVVGAGMIWYARESKKKGWLR